MNDTERRALAAALHDLVAEPVPPQSWLAERVATAYARRRRRRIAAGAAATAVAVLAVGVAWLVPGVAGPGRSVLDPAGARHPGWRGATGVVVARPGQPVRFCPALLQQSGDCGSTGVPVEGVRLSRLDEREPDGTRIGSQWLAGEYRDGVLHVLEQRGPRWPDRRPRYASLDCVESRDGRAPAPPPAGDRSVRVRAATAVVDAYTRTHPRAFARQTTSGDSTPWPPIVLTAYDAVTVATDLHVSRGGDICVVQSAYTRQQIEQARTAVEGRNPHDGKALRGPEDRPYDDAQMHYWVHVDVETAQARALAARFPKGLVQLDVWLKEL